MTGLLVEDVSISFGGVKAVQELSFNVEKGAIFSIIGPNGAGKTSLFNAITGIAKADRGRILYGGVNLMTLGSSEIARKGLSRTFQNLELFPEASVEENVLSGRHIHFRSSMLSEALNLPSARAQEEANRIAVRKILAMLDLEKLRDAQVGVLPYGICKIIELARALAAEPTFLLLDEPAAGLNAAETVRMGGWIKRINSELGVTVLLIEHDMRLVGDISHRVLALNAGRILAEGTAREVQTNPDVIQAYIGG